MRRPFPLTSMLLFVALAWCASAFALNPDLDISQFAHTAWRVRDGFAKGSIVSIAQTPDGYLWFGTEFGVLRFDGNRAVPWEPPRNQHVPPGIVMSLIVSRDGTLWIGATGLASYRNGQITQYPELAGKFIRSLLQDREGTIWVGAGDPGRLCSIRDGITNCYEHEASFGRFVASLYEDHSGNLWVGASNGLWRWKPGPPKFYPLASEPDGVAAISEGADAEILIGWKDGIYRFANGRSTPYLRAGKSHNSNVHRMLSDREGGLWIATVDRGLVHLHQGSTDGFSAVDGLTGNVVYSLFEDRENNIWVSTIDGLDRFRDFAVTTLTTKQGLSTAFVGSALAGNDGSVWLATYSGLNRLDKRKIIIPIIRNATLDTKLNGSHPNSLFQDRLGRIWISTLNGLAYVENGSLVSVEGLPGGNTLSIAQDAEGNIWVIIEQAGLFRISPKMTVERIPWSQFGRADHASVLAADHRQGGLWIGFFLGGVAYFSHDKIRTSYTIADQLGAGRVSDFYFDNEGTLWISTEGGLSRLKMDRLATLTSKNGLPCDTVHWAIEDDDHSFWLYTACGLVRIARSELDAWASAADKQRDATHKVQVIVFDNSDGVRSLASPGHYHPQVVKTPDGRIWFLPWDGVSVIDPHHLPFNGLPPPVYIERVVADGKEYDSSNGMQLPARVQHIDIDYTALSLVVPEKNRFRFKLEGYDRDWRDVGNRRQAFYTNLEPRKYRFRVIACNNSGVWNETGASLEFSIAPAYYQTLWFRALCVAAFFALLWTLYQRRLQVIRRQYAAGLEASVSERLRIARELHDTLLQSIQGAAFQLQTARKLLLRKAENGMEALDEAITATDEAITEGRSAIHDLRPEPVAQRSLPELLNATGRELAETHQLNGTAPAFHVLVEGKQRDLARMLQDEVFRISREVIRNAFAHARASRIEVEIHYDNDQLRVRIRDDGKGIAPQILEAGGQSGHFGIPGIRERAQRIGSRLQFWSEAGAGTEVELAVPAAMAYRKQRNGRRFRFFPKADTDG